MDVANLIVSESLAFQSNGSQYPRSAVFGDRDVQIGDSVEIVGRVQGGSAGCVENTFTTKVLGFVPTVSAGSVGEVTKQSNLDNPSAGIEVTSSNSMAVYNAANPTTPLSSDIDISASGTYNGIASGFIKESYTVYLTRVIKTAGCEEVLANIISGSGTDTVGNVSITAGGTFRSQRKKPSRACERNMTGPSVLERPWLRKALSQRQLRLQRQLRPAPQPIVRKRPGCETSPG